MQASSFDEEIKFLPDHRQTKTVLPTSISQFGLFLENGIVKCKGRMNNTKLLGSARNPILLPAMHDFVPFGHQESTCISETLRIKRHSYYDKRVILDLERL